MTHGDSQGRSHPGRRTRAGFTLVEVVVATGILGLVGAGIVSFLGAFATSAGARTRVSDPALEGALALRRIERIVPALRTVLSVDDGAAVLWASDRVPSRTVHLSELACLRVDADRGELLLEMIDEAALLEDRSLETEFEARDDFRAAVDAARRAGLLRAHVIAEGLDGATLSLGRTRSSVVLALTAAGAASSVVLSPASPEEPLR